VRACPKEMRSSSVGRSKLKPQESAAATSGTGSHSQSQLRAGGHSVKFNLQRGCAYPAFRCGMFLFRTKCACGPGPFCCVAGSEYETCAGILRCTSRDYCIVEVHLAAEEGPAIIVVFSDVAVDKSSGTIQRPRSHAY
jgi:hypothetical protein